MNTSTKSVSFVVDGEGWMAWAIAFVGSTLAVATAAVVNAAVSTKRLRVSLLDMKAPDDIQSPPTYQVPEHAQTTRRAERELVSLHRNT
jgi:hypothetical protein